MPYTFLDSTGLWVTSGPGTTPAMDTTGATLLVVFSLGGVAGVTDSYENTWETATEYVDDGTYGGIPFGISYCENPICGAGHTFTQSSRIIAAVAFAGRSGTGLLDGDAGAFVASGQTGQPGSISPAEDNEVLVAAVFQIHITGPGTDNPTIGSGFTLDEAFYLSGAHLAIAHRIQTTAVAVNPTWTSTWTSASHFVAMASFKDGPPPTPVDEADTATVVDTATMGNFAALKADTATVAETQVLAATFATQSDTATVTDTASTQPTHIQSDTATVVDTATLGDLAAFQADTASVVEEFTYDIELGHTVITTESASSNAITTTELPYGASDSE